MVVVQLIQSMHQVVTSCPLVDLGRDLSHRDLGLCRHHGQFRRPGVAHSPDVTAWRILTLPAVEELRHRIYSRRVQGRRQAAETCSNTKTQLSVLRGDYKLYQQHTCLSVQMLLCSPIREYPPLWWWRQWYKGGSINELQNGAIPLILKTGKIRKTRFVGNLIVNIRRNFFDDDVISVTSSLHRTQPICVLFSPSFL